MNPAQFLDLYRHQVAPLYRAVSQRVRGDRSMAEDVVQEAFLRAVVAWRLHGIPARPGAWLHTVAMNLIRNQSRRPMPLELQPDAAPAPDADAGHDTAEENVELESLQAGLTQLHPSQVQLLTERHVDGKTLSQLAAHHGMTERAIEGRLHRARNALRGRITPTNTDATD